MKGGINFQIKDPKLPKVFQIDYMNEADELDIAHLNDDCRNVLQNMIENYKPNKIRDIDTKTKLILKDDEPIYAKEPEDFLSKIKKL